ncbi:30S ribosomal protein S8 [Candidatus Roizmanbacteria bacterium]|nr:30S ribosomal protein S8 [Candidatus Roizmanbacteria bacterium]
MSHSISDLIIRIKNGYGAQKESITTPHSVYKEAVVKKLKELGYVGEYSVSGEIKKEMQIELIYKGGEGVLTDVKIYSTPGRRWYAQAAELKPVLSGMGYSLLSTPQGIMTNIEARKKHIGGELLFAIW